MSTDTVIAPGLYGKLPSRGDFVSRNLPRSFVEPWDQWLQQVLADSRSVLDSRWLDCYLTSPLWRFLLSPGLCDQTAWLGILMPSVDKVGRYFPLTLAAPVSEQSWLTDLIRSNTDWFERAEKLILTALEDQLDLETFIEQTAKLSIPATITYPDPDSDNDDLAWQCTLASTDELGHAYNALTEFLLRQHYENYSLWWSHGSEHIDPCMLVCQRLPSSKRFAGLLAGDWSHFGWTQAPMGGNAVLDTGYFDSSSTEEIL